jgi:VanZ family protein
MNIKHLVWWWGPVVAWCGLIFWLSSIPNLRVSENSQLDELLRSTAHAGEYTVLFMLVYRALIRNKLSTWQLKTSLLALGLTISYALSDELHQQFVPTRSGNWLDITIDSFGALIGWSVIGWWGWWTRVLGEAGVGSSEVEDRS